MMNLYTVKDHVAKTYLPPFTLPTNRDAIDGFKMVCNDEKTNYNKFPEDYSLMALGSYDERTALFDTHEPQELIKASELLKKGN